MHLLKFPQLKNELDKVYKLVYDKKILPSMRSMQFAGKPIIVNPARNYNCSYLPILHPKAFSEVMFLLLGGTGVGYSVQFHHVSQLPKIIKPKEKNRRHLVGDSIEGWADAVDVLINSYFNGTSKIVFDFSDIRKKGSLLKTSGGRAPGPTPLKICLIKIEEILNNKQEGCQLTSLECHDIICHLADAVLAGGIRRAACISLFSADDDEMISCKYGNWSEKNPQRARANNSAVLLRHRIKEKFFLELWDKIHESKCGEPGIIFSNDCEYGVNPCAEISLRANQLCNLTEINTSTIESQEDFEERVRAATFLGTIQASYTDFHYLRPIWQRTCEKEALLGVSMTGIAVNKLNNLDIYEGAIEAFKENSRVAELIGINPSARITCIKPAGTTTLVLGCNGSGIHGVHSEYYIRRMRVLKNESIYDYLKNTCPELLEDDYFSLNEAVISIPQKSPAGSITRNENVMDLLNRVKHYYNNWVKPGHISGNNTHNVSATISIKDDEWKQVGDWAWENRDYYNGLSVIPYDEKSTTFKQMPFETCDKETYNILMKKLVDIDLTKVIELEDDTNLTGEIACQGNACTI